MTARFNHRWSVLAFALGLAACGGGGGSDSGKGGDSTTYTLSGTISVVETSAVDSDLNDPNQSGYKLNHNPADPLHLYVAYTQAIATPVLLTGTVNEANSGAAGNNYATGDTDDYFKVDLTAGQVVELEFAADETANDIDLYVYGATGSIAGQSNSTTTRYECVTITSTGTYYVNVSAYSGASIYSLRIGAPGTGGSCDNSTAAFGTTTLLAKPHDGASAQALSAKAASAHQTLLGRAGVRHEVPEGLGPHRLHLPATTAARRAGLEALTGRGRSSAAASTKSAASAGGVADLSTQSADSAESRIAAMASTLRYAKALRATGAYAYVEPDWVMQRTNTTIGSFPPDDRYYSYQKWHYEQIQLPAAINRIMALTRQPTQRPIVAVIDSGVALDHPDIAPQLFSNGRSFVGGSSTASGDDVSTSEDSVFHGTHVAGTIAASTYDGAGAAGVAPMAQILPLNVFGSRSGASTSDIVNAILYAAGLTNTSGFVPTRRADVINMSLGGSGTCSDSFRDAIAKARNAGVIVVAAAGNENVSTVGQPANCAGVIAVGATQADKTRAPYSNTGSAMKVAAPGGNTGVSTTGNGQPDGIFSSMASITSAGRRVSTLGYLQGTSMASPHVAGVMALMRYVNKDITVDQIDRLLSRSDITDDLGDAGWDRTFGYGLINADKAVTAAISSTGTTPPVPAGQVVASPASLDFGSFQTSAVLSLAYSGSSSETVTSVKPSNSVAMTVTPQASVGSNGLGPYTVTVDRSKLTSTSTYLTITVTLNTGRTFVIPVAVSKPGSVARSGGFGPVYLLLTDAGTGEVLKQVAATATSTGYTWSASGVAAGSYGIIAGTDLDNDGYICQRGEACGGYPVIEAVIDGQGVEVRGNRSDLNFQIAPLSGISALSTRNGGSAGLRRLNPQP